MPVPDKVVFGPNDPTGELDYGAVRKLPAEEQLRALQRRLGAFFVGQVEELSKPEGGVSKVYSPFPLFLMTCVGIETLGKIFYDRPLKEKENPADIQRDGFLTVCGQLHQHFSRPLNKEQQAAYDGLWGDGEHKRAGTPSMIIYRLGRNTMAHGYQGRGVYNTEGIGEWALDEGAMIINPYWFWRTFKNVGERLWARLHANKEANNPMRKAASRYLAELLK